MDRFVDWVLARAQERTTWIGVVALLSGVGVAVSPELQTAVVEVGLAVSGLVLIWRKERAGSAGRAKRAGRTERAGRAEATKE